MVPFFVSARLALEGIHPAAPWALLTLAIFGAVYASRKFLPGVWAWLDTVSPDGMAAHVVQGLPSLLGGALLSVGLTGGDYREAWKGALAGALAPVVHLLMKAAPIPYQGAVRAAATKAGISIVGLVLAVFLLAGCSVLKGVPALSALDAIGRGVAHVVGWCEDRGIQPATVETARQAIADRDYPTALDLATRLVAAARAKGDPIPEEVEVTLRLAEGALAAQAIQDGMRALSKP